jgi:sec-independent protein translocase protein TatB
MLPEVGASELVLIAIVALIVVGPKDLPVLLRKLGQFMAKLRGMANEFRASFDEMARQSELDELRKEVDLMRRGQMADMAAHDASNAQVSQVFSEINEGLAGGGMQFPLMSQPYGEAEALEATAPVSEPAPAPKAAKPRAPRKPKTAVAETAPVKPAAAKPATTKAAPKARAPAKPKAAAATVSTPRRRTKSGTVT